MSERPEEAEVRRIKRSYQRFLNGNPYGVKATTDAQAIVALCDSWMAQARVMDEACQLLKGLDGYFAQYDAERTDGRTSPARAEIAAVLAAVGRESS